MAKKRVDKGVPGMELLVCRNPKAAQRYEIEERLEAGLVLYGTEVKSLRARRANLEGAYCRIDDDELFLYGMHIAPYEQANRFNHDPVRPRRLLLHKKEIRKLWNDVRQKGMTIIPTRVYLKSGRAKVEIALARGKKSYDKREAIAKRDRQRNMERESRVR